MTIINTNTTKLMLNDASRPWAVMNGNRCIGRYETEAKAKRFARDREAA